jgi:asparagine synthase (glutamine-hydrolysing)
MCGICGIVAVADTRGRLRARVEAMATLIAHRGPDASGFFEDEGVVLGHRRLSIVDLAAGQQPMSTVDRRTTIVFNGEIYNHTDLRRDLEARGADYRTRSDTESILHLISREGADASARLRGMFAYAIWDASRRELTLARDHTGIKPLYYAFDVLGTLAFASEIKALVASGIVEPTLDPALIEEYFATGHVSGHRTLLAGVYKLEPGTSLTWRNGAHSVRRFWRPGDQTRPVDSSRTVPVSPAAEPRNFWSRFVDAVHSQLMSDVPLGVFLSGGLDSSLIVAAMKTLGVERIRSFSVGYREQEASELPWARLVATAMGTEHHEVVVDGADFFEGLPELTWSRDFPMTFSASIPLFHVARLAREHVTVVLTGEGSDELFAGYGRYPRALLNWRIAERLDRWSPVPVRHWLSRVARQPRSGHLSERLARSAMSYPATFEGAFLEPFADFHGPWREQLLSPDLPRGTPWGDLQATLGSLGQELTTTSGRLDAMLRYDQVTYMEELLMKQDSMSMAVSLESRVPFLDHWLVEWAATLPRELKLDGMTGKAVVRAAAREHLPREVVDGPKRGFLVPLGKWLRTVGRQSLEQYVVPSDPLFNSPMVRRLVTEHVSGSADHTARLWRLIAFQVWQRDVMPRLRSIARDASSVMNTTIQVGGSQA